ncbi:MAG: hypothetical protein ILP02_04715, partial [Clostridia bacterium]|nr:hypothetical protein [Clostridia bacterium]
MQTLTADLKKLADDMSANDALNALKDRLTDLKERLIKAPDDEKDAVKAEMKGVLSEITRINLDNFALLSKKRREIDALNDKIKAIVQSKKDDLKDVEAEVLSSAREMVKQTVFAYGAEAEALAKAFGVKDYRKQPYFLSVINPELKLVDFNKDAIIKAVREKRERDRTHGHDHDH